MASYAQQAEKAKKDFSIELLRARSEANMKQEALAKDIGCVPSYITKMEKGHSVPSPKIAERLENVLRIETGKLVNLVLRYRFLTLRHTIQEPSADYSEKLDKLIEESAVESRTSITARHPTSVESTMVYESKIPVVSRAGASTEKGRFEFEPVEHEFIEFKHSKAVEVTSNSMAPTVFAGQKIIYSETEDPHDGDLVFCKVKGRGQLFKRYHIERRDHKRYLALVSINPVNHEPPIVIPEEDMVWCYKVVGVRF